MSRTATDLSLEERQTIAHELLGTCDLTTLFRLEEEFDLEDDLEVGIAAESCDVWQCEGCQWWVELHELDEDYFCEDCQ